MNLNTHAHPYGVFIGGNEMGTPGQTGVYFAAYGNGKFIVRGFGPAPFKMNGFLGVRMMPFTRPRGAVSPSLKRSPCR